VTFLPFFCLILRRLFSQSSRYRELFFPWLFKIPNLSIFPLPYHPYHCGNCSFPPPPNILSLLGLFYFFLEKMTLCGLFHPTFIFAFSLRSGGNRSPVLFFFFFFSVFGVTPKKLSLKDRPIIVPQSHKSSFHWPFFVTPLSIFLHPFHSLTVPFLLPFLSPLFGFGSYPLMSCTVNLMPRKLYINSPFSPPNLLPGYLPIECPSLSSLGAPPCFQAPFSPPILCQAPHLSLSFFVGQPS